MLLQVKLNGQVVGEVPASDLRDLRAVAFSVPVVAGSYNLTVVAQDSRGCSGVTTLARPVVVP